MGAVLTAFTRRKDYTPTGTTLGLKRSLDTVDLVFLGVGSTLGAGVYVATADIARESAGPSTIISFILGALIFVPNVMCYAEFASRIPRAGSVYSYTYVTLGEITAFLVGWNMLLQYLIGAAAIARAWSSFIDGLAMNEISTNLMEGVASWKTPGISKYPDFLSLAVCVATSVILLIGVKISSIYNRLMTFIHLVLLIFIFVLSLVYARLRNWRDFFPYGFSGAISASKATFFAYVGIEIIASSAEEVKNPATTIPKSMFISMVICLFCYVAMTISATLLSNYKELKVNGPLPQAFHERGVPWAKFILAIGGLAGLTSSLLGTMFTVPRLLYTMANDGLMFYPFAGVNKTTHTPIFATLFTGIACGWLALYFELSTLVEMISIGTLQAYTMVAMCILLLRYQVKPLGYLVNENDVNLLWDDSVVNERETVRMSPTNRTFMLVIIATITVVVSIGLIATLTLHFGLYLLHGYFLAIVIFFVLLGIFSISITIITLQPQNAFELPFKVPMVPIVPVAAIFVNMFMAMGLSGLTWARFGLWMLIGLTIYLFYGVAHSKEDRRNKETDGPRR